MRIRQVALVAKELGPVVEDLCEVFGIEVAYNDPSIAEFGLDNAVMAIGDTFLEVVSPVKEGTTAGRLLEKRNGDGGYMVIVQTEDLDAERKRMDRLGVRIVWEVDHPDAATMHLHPKDVGGAILSLDVARPPESWRWAGPEWPNRIHTGVVAEIVGAEIQSDNPSATAERWASVLNSTATEPENGERRVDIDGSRVRFVSASDGRGPGVSGFDLRVNDAGRILSTAKDRGLNTTDNSVRICGTIFRIED